MKATGLIRRIDDLGRVVIPKEIRRSLRIHEGDPLEIYMDREYVLFKKYDPNIIVSEIVKDLREAVSETGGLCVNHELLLKIEEVEAILAKAEQDERGG